MLTRVLRPRGAAWSVGRLFATSVPRWDVPTSNPGVRQSLDSMEGSATELPLSSSVEGPATATLDAAAIKAQLAQLKTAQHAIQKAELEARKERIAASIAARDAKRVAALEARQARIERARQARIERLTAKRKEVRPQEEGQQSLESMEGTATASLDADAIKAQLAQLYKAQQAIQQSEMKARKEQIAAKIVVREVERIARLEACRARLQSWLAKRKAIRARVADHKEQAATRAASDLAETKAVAALQKVKTTSLGKLGKPVQSGEHHFSHKEKAAANLKVREAANAKLQGLVRMSGYSLFAKTNFKKTAESIPDSLSFAEGGKTANRLVMMTLGAKWKALSPKERTAYKIKANSIRADAQKNQSEMA